MDNLPISFVLLKQPNNNISFAKMATMNDTKEGKVGKFFSSFLKIARKSQLLFLKTGL